MAKLQANPFNGALLINKDSGPTSHDVVAKLRRIAGQKSVGHTGTLDPMASGLMIILFGEATKCSDLILNANKSYVAKIKLGITTDTLDTTGKILSESTPNVTEEQILKTALMLQGDLQLQIPWFSAVKVDGQKFYEQARKLTFQEMQESENQPPLRSMNFYGVQVLKLTTHDVEVSLSCSKGSFIRSWVQEFGRHLGCGATMSGLIRTASGSFKLENAITIADAEKLSTEGLIQEGHPSILTMNELLPQIKGCLANPKEESLLHHGQIPRAIFSRLLPEVRLANSNREEITIKVVSGQKDRLLALLVAKPGQGLKFKRVFSYPELTVSSTSL